MRPVPCGQWFLFVSCIVVHTVDVFGVEVEHVGKSSTVATKWVGSEFLRRPHPILAGHSSAKGLLTRRETSMSLARRPVVSAERYP